MDSQNTNVKNSASSIEKDSKKNSQQSSSKSQDLPKRGEDPSEKPTPKSQFGQP